MRYRRSNFCFFYFDNARGFDPSRVGDDGEVIWEIRRGAFAVSVISQKVVHIELEVLEALYEMERNGWEKEATLSRRIAPERLDDLARDGILLCDSEAPPYADLKRRHDLLEAEQWHPYSALYYFMSQWRRPLPGGTDHDREVEEPARLIERHGPPPPSFHRRSTDGSWVPLRRPQVTSPVFENLLARRSSRHFDPNRSLRREDLETLLYYVWGCQGRMEFTEGVELLKKTSASGGALHPIEVYPVVCQVEGLAPGVYHYEVGGHGLRLLEAMECAAARRLAVELTVGQDYFHDVQVAFVMTGRFFRNFWKYHQIDKALSVILMDAAFLGQTFYLVAAELGLGALFTAAVNALAAERHLALDGFREGPLAVCACGARHRKGDGEEATFAPYPAP